MTQPFRGDRNHQWDTDESLDRFLTAYRSMTDYRTRPLCRHCAERRAPIAMAGTAWGWESFHERHCPEHEDNQEVVAVRVTENFNGAEYTEAEAIWSASEQEQEEES